NASWVVTLDQQRAIFHTPDTGADQESSLSAANLVQLTATITDKDGDSTSATVDLGSAISFRDDGPTAASIVKTGQAAVGTDTNLLIVLDNSGSMGDNSGTPGMSRLDVAKNALLELFEQYDALGNVKVCLVSFDTTANIETLTWVTIATAKAVVLALGPENSTNYDDALIKAIDAYGETGKIPAGANVQNVAYFLSDGLPNQPSGDAGISNVNGTATTWQTAYNDITPGDNNASEEQTWINFLNANDIRAYALGMGTGIGPGAAAALNPIAYDAVGAGTGTNTNAILVTDLSQLTATLVATAHASPINGNLTDAGGGFGADGGYVRSITVGGITYSYTQATDTSSQSGAGTSAGSFNTGTNEWTVTSVTGGVIKVDMDNGAFTYTPPSTIGAVVNENIVYVLIDTDGDTASQTLNVHIDPASGPLIVRDDLVVTNAPSVSGSDPILIPKWALLSNDTGPNSTLLAIAAITAITDSVAPLVLADPSVTFNDGSSNGGSFQYTVTGGETAVVDVARDLSGALDGSFRNEILLGTSSGETLNANGGDDILIGGGGNDTLNAGEGNDILVGGLGNDSLVGGSGNDTASYIDSASGVTATMLTATGAGTDTLSGMENLIGSNFADSLTGDSSSNILAGLAGMDTLIGDGGNDFLIGGLGNDSLTGGTGADTFVWQAGDSGTDVVTDFVAGTDTLDLSALLDGEASTVASLNTYLTFSFGATTTITADSNGASAGGDLQVIQLAGADLAAHYGSATAATVIAGMLADDSLLVAA
ncbi:MAG: type I secretion C-terminal target domain-containing protein, partial [Pseudomonadaceae bacterium]|nr:type I secretion C-terminal target domain-containing protein [Pseudomonadaceae bacterium]